MVGSIRQKGCRSSVVRAEGHAGMLAGSGEGSDSDVALLPKISLRILR